uniref:RING-type E3 ubiquitin transferase n=1 Tax=Pan troglodytes TaxID=9598 RepID=A0A2I3RY60_PANTR
MTTGDCCHLPGSLCDCSGSPAFSKVVEATGLGPPQYVAQVTSRDGRLLSTVIRALDTPSAVLTVTSCLEKCYCELCHTEFAVEETAAPQVSFRYHCQLYSEWRKTNQKVRLKIREADSPEGPQHSPLAAGLLKKVAEETPV